MGGRPAWTVSVRAVGRPARQGAKAGPTPPLSPVLRELLVLVLFN